MTNKTWKKQYSEKWARAKYPPTYFDPEDLFEKRYLKGLELQSVVKGRDWRYETNADTARKMMKLFWWCSIMGKWNEFPFEETLEQLETYFGERLLYLIVYLHKNYPEMMKEYPEEPEEISHRQRQALIQKMGRVYEQGKGKEETYGYPLPTWIDQMRNFLKVYDAIKEASTRGEKIRVIDRVIHLEHARGNIWGVWDLEMMHHKFEEKYR